MQRKCGLSLHFAFGRLGVGMVDLIKTVRLLVAEGREVQWGILTLLKSAKRLKR